MKEHKKHKHHPHDKMAAMPQFNEGHWEKKPGEVELGGGRYSSEFNQEEEYKKQVDDLSRYSKKHKPTY
ncbi:MAG: hypothetical protein ABFD00_10405 [Chloroherpetonaceae bacterium]